MQVPIEMSGATDYGAPHDLNALSADRERIFKEKAASSQQNPGRDPIGSVGAGIKSNVRDLPALNAIHILFLFYSGAHNTLNAFDHAQNLFFFLFVVVGILSVELMLWSIYKYWKEGRLVGKMLTASKFAGVLAMFFAIAGILAESQAGTANGWLATYYQWILPCSAPVMFICGFWIQSMDPIMAATRDTQAYELLLKAESKRDILDAKRMLLNERRDQRLLQSQLLNLKQNALWKETLSRRTRRQLKVTVREEVPLLLEKAGIHESAAHREAYRAKQHATTVGGVKGYQIPGDGAREDVTPF